MRAIIIDDEQNCIEVLQYELERLNIALEVVETFTNPRDAIPFLAKHSTDIIFLDIEMPGMNAFQFLDSLKDIDANIIFTTAYDQYALKAFRYYAVDYLLKPIEGELLQESLMRIKGGKRMLEKNMIDEIYTKIKAPNSVFSRIAVPIEHGYKMLKIEDVVMCSADGNYSIVKLASGKELVVSKTLKYFQQLLEEHGFLRVHQSKLINTNFIDNYSRIDGGVVTLIGGERVSVSRANKKKIEMFLQG